MKRSFLFFIVFFLVLTGFANSLTELDLASRFRHHVRILTSDTLQGRGLGTEGSQRARDYIVEAFAEAGIKPFDEWEEEYIQPFSFRQGLAWISAYNIAGYIEGTDSVLKNEFIVIGAHYDHLGYEMEDGEKTIYPGADDNASGVAAIIELGRYFSQHPDLLGRSLIIVAFDAEESGLVGSGYFIDQLPVPIEKAKLMFSFDMVGMYTENNGLELRGIGSMVEGRELAAQIAVQQNIELRNTSSNIERRTDTAPFGDAGIPSVHVFTGTKSPYHKPEDVYQLLDFEGMKRIHQYMTVLIRDVSRQQKIDAEASLIAHAEAVKSGSISKRASVGFLVNTGSGFHRYTEEFYRANSIFNISTGLFVQIPLTDGITLQPEVLYDLNGSKVEEGEMYRHSLSFPFNVQIGMARTPDNPVRTYVFGGPYYRYSFAGNTAGTRLDFQVYDQQEWGYSFGIALEIFQFTVGYTYRRGINGLFLDEGQPEILQSNKYFTVGYSF